MRVEICIQRKSRVNRFRVSRQTPRGCDGFYPIIRSGLRIMRALIRKTSRSHFQISSGATVADGVIWRPTFMRQWRESRGLTLQQMKVATGKVESTLARIEKGELPYNQRVLEGYAAELQIDVEQLFRAPREVDSLRTTWDRIRNKDQALKMLKAFGDSEE